MPKINTTKTLELLESMKQEDFRANCTHCNKELKVKRCYTI